jgi:hypothetical protein
MEIVSKHEKTKLFLCFYIDNLYMIFEQFINGLEVSTKIRHFFIRILNFGLKKNLGYVSTIRKL